jgi:hypothetical protein
LGIGLLIFFICRCTRWRGRDRDLEVEFTEQWTRKIRVFIASFQDYAVELLLSNGYRPVGLFLPAASETIELASVEKWDPFCLAGCPPMEESEEGPS